MNKHVRQFGIVVLTLNAIMAAINLIFNLPVNIKMLLIQSFVFSLYIAIHFSDNQEKED